MTEVNIIKIDGKPLEKLIDVVSGAIGRLYQYKEIRKRAEAEAYAIQVLARANASASFIVKEEEYDFLQRIEGRLNHVEQQRQRNIDNIVYGSAEELRNSESVSDEPVDPDWTTRFFETVKDVSNEEMQALWSKILAGEIKQPKTYSLRTIELLRNLSSADARLIQSISKYVIRIGKFRYLYYKNINKELKAIGFPYPDFLHLIELGILSSNDAQYLLEKGESQIFFHGDTSVFIMAVDKPCAFNVTPFTSIGNELIALLNLSFDKVYFNLVCKDINLHRKQANANIIVSSPVLGNQPIENYLAQE
jgi:hypothetical protein